MTNDFPDVVRNNRFCKVSLENFTKAAFCEFMLFCRSWNVKKSCSIYSPYAGVSHKNFEIVDFLAVLKFISETFYMQANMLALIKFMELNGLYKLSLSFNEGMNDLERLLGWRTHVEWEILSQWFIPLIEEDMVSSFSVSGRYDFNDPLTLKRMLNDFVTYVSGRKPLVKIVIPILGGELIDCDISFASRVALKRFSQREKAWFMYKNDDLISFDDIFTPHKCDIFLEVFILENKRISWSKNEVFLSKINSIVALIKWAVYASSGVMLQETFAIAERFLGRHRLNGLIGNERIYSKFAISSDCCVQAEKIFSLFKNSTANGQYEELNDALIFFNKSSVELISGDRLLYAVMGMERILLPVEGGGSEKFRQLGSLLLDRFGIDKDEFFALYQSRNRVAHGGNAYVEHEKSEIAVKCLSMLIKSVVLIVDANLFPPKEKHFSKDFDCYSRGVVLGLINNL